MDGAYAYLASDACNLRVVDLGDPASPVEVATYTLPGSAMDVAVSGGLAYVPVTPADSIMLCESAPAAVTTPGA